VPRVPGDDGTRPLQKWGNVSGNIKYTMKANILAMFPDLVKFDGLWPYAKLVAQYINMKNRNDEGEIPCLRHEMSYCLSIVVPNVVAHIET
jgi:hypothetical protein